MKPIFNGKKFLGYAAKASEQIWNVQKCQWEFTEDFIREAKLKFNNIPADVFVGDEPCKPDLAKSEGFTIKWEKPEVVGLEDKSMNYLSGKRVYLAGAISMDSSDGKNWRSEITPRLQEFGVIVDDPCKTVIANGKGEVGADKAYFRQLIKDRKFEQLKKEFYPVVRKDLRSVDLANFLIVGHDPDIPTVGTIHEIVIATHIEKKPVLLFCPPEKLDSLNPWMLTFFKKQWIFTDWNDMFKYLNLINQGTLDSSHWVL